MTRRQAMNSMLLTTKRRYLVDLTGTVHNICAAVACLSLLSFMVKENQIIRLYFLKSKHFKQEVSYLSL